ncbi:ABC transporter substrate-binding protein [Brevibacillus laterosporus]|uniref:ABC transporter substrate-binding protein n=1 Tax=Brevibacillus laterosporus TaxID=1465 RepID=A0AAP3G7B2_BRELA|nr:ABC transporter substrate-binding protein [Brevibacillus laterosporus]MCR8980148.1 ABC transporter substrate-binding protein [Brevibacillus laterosporus]MCZ0807303.1 ABC transporter substrate-binding protein [Brevibacillus laterosporus]MCZ0825588.1 ABC transporter substrate-binding protein [Brevibacillus laterosporus]MCZ0849366.1 ABC transporter substrate-binding protein [Brevibacillus laterosporus]
MTKRFGIISIMMSILLFLSGCASEGTAPQQQGDQSQTVAESGKPKSGGSLVIAVGDDPSALNPNYAGDRVTLTINQSLFAPLFTINDGKKTFVLAESLTQSKDFLTYTLKLRDNLTWHDGKKLTADDVVFTLASILDEKQHSPQRSLFVLDGKPIQVKKVDDTTVDFVLPQVSAAFEGALVQVSPIPKHIFENVEDIEKSEKNFSPVGSGPFKFKEYKPGEYVTLERFDNYFAGKSYLDTVTYRITKDTNAANLAMQNGEIQMKFIDPQDYNKMNDMQMFNLIKYNEGRLVYMAFNLNIDVLQKKEVRQAIAYAIDKNELVHAAYSSLDYAEPAHSLLTPDALYYTKELPTYEYNVEKAKDLLKKAGVNHLKLRLAYVNNNKPQTSQALYLQQKLKDIGIDIELQPLDPAAFSNKSQDMKNKDYDLSFGGYIMGYEPDAYKSLFVSTEAFNYSHYNNKEFDQLWSKAAVEVDTAKRAELYKKIQETVADDVPIYPIAYPKSIIAVDKRFGGLQEAVTKPVTMFEDLSKIYEQ